MLSALAHISTNGNLIVALTAYLDDSGTDPANPTLVVGGFVSEVKQWDWFVDEWTGAETEFGAPPFHAKHFDDARRGYGPYVSWGQKKRKDFLNRLLRIINHRCAKSFSTALQKNAYDIIIKPQLALREYFYSPFVFAAVNTIHAVCDWRDAEYPGEPTLFIFDRGNRNEGELKGVGKQSLVGDDRLIEDVGTADDTKLPPLRAADLLAFELCAEVRNVAGQKTEYSRYPLLMLSEQPHEWLQIGERQLLCKIEQLVAEGTLRVQE